MIRTQAKPTFLTATEDVFFILFSSIKFTKLWYEQPFPNKKVNKQQGHLRKAGQEVQHSHNSTEIISGFDKHIP
jgi:hypothetical protein